MADLSEVDRLVSNGAPSGPDNSICWGALPNICSAANFSSIMSSTMWVFIISTTSCHDCFDCYSGYVLRVAHNLTADRWACITAKSSLFSISLGTTVSNSRQKQRHTQTSSSTQQVKSGKAAAAPGKTQEIPDKRTEIREVVRDDLSPETTSVRTTGQTKPVATGQTRGNPCLPCTWTSTCSACCSF